MFLKRFLQDGIVNEQRIMILNEIFDKYVELSESELSKNLYMDKSHVYELYKSGHHIGCHGYDHLRWNKLKDHELNFELNEWSKFYKKLGILKDHWTACYPYGAKSADVKNKLRKLGCSLAFSTDASLINLNYHNPLDLPRMNTNDFPK